MVRWLTVCQKLSQLSRDTTRFCVSDKFVVFTAAVRGEVDLAVAQVDDLIDRTT
jgi:hypothetical protein